MNQSEVCDDIDNNCDWNGLVYSQCSLSDVFIKCVTNFMDQSLILTSYEKLLIL